MQNVLYVPGATSALDYAKVGPGGVIIALFDGRTLEELDREFPGVTVGSEAEFEALRQQAIAQ